MPQLNIELLVNNQPAMQSTRRMTDEVARQERQFQRLATEGEKSAKKLADAQAKQAERQRREFDKLVNDQLKAAERALAQRTKADERAAAGRIKDAERVARYVEREEARMARAAERAAQQQQRAAEKASAAQQRAAEKAASAAEASAAKMNAALAGAALAGAAMLGKALQDINAAMDKAAQRSRELAQNFGAGRDQLGELAAIQGKTLDNQFALDFARFNRQTGMTAAESKAYQTQLYNAGVQYSGKNISAPEFGQYAEQAGRLGQAWRLQPDVMGDLAGSLLGSRDYSRFGENASEQALADLNKMLAIGSRGRGENRVLADAMSKLMAANMSEDEFRGTFRTGEEVATLVSTIAESRPQEPEVYARAAIRGLRGKEAAPLREAAGITPNMPFFEQINRIAPLIEKEARAGGTNVNDVVSKYFNDEREQVGIATLINRGVAGGVIADRMRFGAENEGVGAAFGRINQYEGTEAAALRRAQADVALAEAQRGAENSGVDILRSQALAELVRTKAIGTGVTGVKDWLSQGGPIKGIPVARDIFNQIPDPEQARINAEASRILERRMQAAGLGTAGFDFDWARSITPEGREATLRGGIEAVRGAGRDPFSDAMNQNNRLLEQNNRLMEQQLRQQGGVRAPLPAGRPQAGFRRGPGN